MKQLRFRLQRQRALIGGGGVGGNNVDGAGIHGVEDHGDATDGCSAAPEDGVNRVVAALRAVLGETSIGLEIDGAVEPPLPSAR